MKQLTDNPYGITVKDGYYSIKVYINDFLHLRLNKEKFLGIHSWTDGKNNCCIEFIFQNGSFRSEYTDMGRWTTILQKLDDVVL